MTLNATSCCAWRLYVIVDGQAAGARSLADLAAAALRGGADVIQLRHKTASSRELAALAERVLEVTRAAGRPLIINDRVDVALAVGADGVHLGQEDLPASAARRLLGPGRLVGLSTHSPEQLLAAQREPVDYVGIGPVFATPTKPAYPSVGTALVKEAAASSRLPFVCIGGIDPDNVAEVVEAGGRCVAVVRAICAAPDPESATRQLKQLITQSVGNREPLPL